MTGILTTAVLLTLGAAVQASGAEDSAPARHGWQPMDLLARAAPPEAGVFEGLTPPPPMESWKPAAQAPVRDSSMEGLCLEAAARIDEKQEEILELKARYWARLLRSSTREFEIRKSLGSVIMDRRLRAHFYDRMRHYYDMRFIPELTKEEIEVVSETDSNSLALLRRCGLKLPKQRE